MDPYIISRVWTFGNGGGLYPRITVTAQTYEDAWDRANRGLFRWYEKADREPPVAWDLVLIDLRLPKPR